MLIILRLSWRTPRHFYHALAIAFPVVFSYQCCVLFHNQTNAISVSKHLTEHSTSFKWGLVVIFQAPKPFWEFTSSLLTCSSFETRCGSLYFPASGQVSAVRLRSVTAEPVEYCCCQHIPKFQGLTTPLSEIFVHYVNTGLEFSSSSSLLLVSSSRFAHIRSVSSCAESPQGWNFKKFLWLDLFPGSADAFF